MGTTVGVFHAVGENSDDHTQDSSTGIKGASSPFSIVTASPPPVAVTPLHSIEKLQAALDALEATKSQQSARLVTALEVLEQDRHECLAGKFRSLHVRCDAAEDLRRMRERSERYRGQRALAVLSKTADWYPELLRRLLAREVAKLFIIQGVRRFTNDGCEFQATQLFQVILHLHHDDLELLHVQQLLVYLRNALHINRDEWLQVFAAHDLPAPNDDIAEDRKDPPEQPRHG
ncbi:hypothetical protein PHYSODRAFT_500752 [Phytophthora sojae]|uniref:Uncharacterized protein n=1 Tax=Phytophthora sojae (strain P6497) TaxID=1094619 RepID=G4ZEP8_PHYSP|nr:hypothetical protein PHYSODRAFT_500752 [Phytophthora sojae]EGZ16571.1 hypothetical protein PHYSODRAFT_500752 [Phytophthora sojae]|eukprot:XP_009525629.1 hypothetical protein PHYSODRAFT_500752 [Phytophthora sojae]